MIHRAGPGIQMVPKSLLISLGIVGVCCLPVRAQTVDSHWGRDPGFYVGDKGGALAISFRKSQVYFTGNQFYLADCSDNRTLCMRSGIFALSIPRRCSERTGSSDPGYQVIYSEDGPNGYDVVVAKLKPTWAFMVARKGAILMIISSAHSALNDRRLYPDLLRSGGYDGPAVPVERYKALSPFHIGQCDFG